MRGGKEEGRGVKSAGSEDDMLCRDSEGERGGPVVTREGGCGGGAG